MFFPAYRTIAFGWMATADSVMLRVLRLPEDTGGTEAEARSAFQTSIALSGLRCLITYLILPFVAPTIGFFAAIGRPLGIFVNLVAMISIVMSMRRFWRVRHAQRWAYTCLGGLMMCFLVFLLARDLFFV
ncbi:MAG: hypothetical protein ACI8TP_001160 [Acidimicrobiales bacterium]|jgi:hypothetical protein